MGEIYIKGPNALDFAQYVTSNDVAALKDGKYNIPASQMAKEA